MRVSKTIPSSFVKRFIRLTQTTITLEQPKKYYRYIFLFSYFFSFCPLCSCRTVRIWIPSTTQCGRSYKSVCTSTTGSRTWKSCASVSRRNGTVWTRKWLTTRSVNGASDWQPALQPADDILINVLIHTLINMFCNLFTLLSVKQIIFSCTSNSLAVIYLLYKSWAKSQNRNTNHTCTDKDDERQI